MLEKASENSEMTVLSEASFLVRQIAEPRPVGDSVKAAIGRAARRLGFSFSRTKTIWYAEAHRIDAHEMDALRRELKRRRQEGIARVEALNTIERLVALRSSLAEADSDFHRETITALDDALRAMGAEIRPVAIQQE